MPSLSDPSESDWLRPRRIERMGEENVKAVERSALSGPSVSRILERRMKERDETSGYSVEGLVKRGWTSSVGRIAM